EPNERPARMTGDMAGGRASFGESSKVRWNLTLVSQLVQLDQSTTLKDPGHTLPFPGLVTVVHSEELDYILAGLGSRWVVLELWAPWSAACAAIRSEFEVLAKSYPTWIFLRADIGQLPGIASRWSVTRIPLYLFFWQGIEETEFAGASVCKLREVLDDCTMLGPAEVAAHADPAGRVSDWKLNPEGAD
ncbi:unnamed protein product, partial [Cladocopium goreaui]